MGLTSSVSPVQQVQLLLGTTTGTVALEVELVPLVGLVELTAESACWKQAQDEALSGMLAVTVLKKKRLLQSQLNTEPLALSQTQLEASRPTGQICLVCMY